MMRAWLFFTCACVLGCSSASFVVAAEDQQEQISDDAGDVLELDSAAELDTAVPPAETRQFDSSSPPPFDSSPFDSSSTSSDAAIRDSHFIDSDIDSATTPPDFGIETETVGVCSVDGDCKSPSNCCDKTKGTCGARLFPYLPCSGS